MTRRRFKQVDVFAGRSFFGNPVAVVLDADGIDAEQMRRIAAWTNLSETTFLLRPSSSDADYRLRIFTPSAELPFAGHPTVGSAHAALEGGVLPAGTEAFKQECGAGILTLSVEGDGHERRIFVRAPEAKVVRECGDVAEELSAALAAPLAGAPAPLAIDVGPVWLVARVESVTALSGLHPDVNAVAGLSRELGVTGVTVFSLDSGSLDAGGDAAVRVRTFAPAFGVPEDPVCGSCNVALGAYLHTTGLIDATGEDYVARQGAEMGRDGRVSVRVREGGSRIEIGGQAVTTIDGHINV